MFELHVLPADQGDALILSWRDEAGSCTSTTRHLLIDAGPVNDAAQQALVDRLETLGVTADRGRLELLVVTHIDGDHVGGVTRLLDGELPCAIGDVWFNGYDHLPTDELGVAQAEMLSDQIVGHGLSWNAAFDHEAVMVPLDETVPLPSIELDGGLRLTVLGPTRARLAALVPGWERYCRKAGLVPGVDAATPADDELGEEDEVDLGDLDALAGTPFRRDGSKPNASSISLLAEHGDHAVLLGGDALGGDLVDALVRLERERGERVTIATHKLPHHGSKANVSIELVEQVGARRHVISSSGSQFHHPDPEAIARIVVGSRRGTELWFNHRSEESLRWDDDDLREEHGYRTVFPADTDAGVVIDLTAPVD